MPGPIFLEGETVELRTIEPEDAAFLQETINDPEVRRTLAANAPITGIEEENWIESLDNDEGVHLLVCVEGEPVGTVGIQPPSGPSRTVELGYFIASDAWGNGYATAAVRLLCRYAFRERGLHKVYADVYDLNPASARVLEKVGFVQEGVHREQGFVDGEHVDVLRYGLLKNELQ
ncbi:GNAT family N-acetyltransferase [Natronomonas sp. EA1]|uniref:GNAT family N-acetyltransferase n=1 Tax=Natronomonas sp. EA1 TaxID=3421655 RepID=UPI003EBCF83C